MHFTKTHTKLTCYLAYVSQAIVCCLAGLLFSAFQAEFSLSLTLLSVIVVVTFACQILVDVVCARHVEKLGYRRAMILSSALTCLGLILLCFLPYLLPPYAGILIAVAVYSTGGGLIDVVVGPIVEAIPSQHKAAQMSLLHSFFCWGTAAVILLATGYFALFGVKNWRFLPLFLAAIPFLVLILFFLVPVPDPVKISETGAKKPLFKTPVFYLMLLLMLLSGAAEQLMSQWASYFAEQGLNVSKAQGDVLGPCAFAVCMGVSRTLYGLFAKQGRLRKLIALSGGLCAACFLLTVFSPLPVLSLVGCALTGFAVGILWPGCISVASERLGSSAKLFAFLALFGDVGCTAGPMLVGLASDAIKSADGGVFSAFIPGNSPTEIALKAGIFLGCIFPLLLIVAVQPLKKLPPPGENSLKNADFSEKTD